MRILVLSDTHGSIKNVLKYMEHEKKFDMAIHLGDYTEDGRRIAAMTGVKMLAVKGNGDYQDEKNSNEEVLEICGKKILVTHGHDYGVKRDLGRLFYRAKELDVDIVLFGHTHISVALEHEGIVLFNPGSSAEPRLGAMPSIGILEVGKSFFEKKIINL